MKSPLPCTTVCVAFALAACSTTRTQPMSAAADIANITAFNARYLKAINDGDIATLSSLTDEDHIMVAPNRPPVVGKRPTTQPTAEVSNSSTSMRAGRPSRRSLMENWLTSEAPSRSSPARRIVADEPRYVQQRSTTHRELKWWPIFNSHPAKLPRIGRYMADI